MNFLPTELFCSVIYNITEEIEPVGYYQQLVKLMLVNQRWQALIDGDPHCWRVLSSTHSQSLVQRAISKSGTGRILLVDFDRGHDEEFVLVWFTSAVLPLFNRWSDLRLNWPLWSTLAPYMPHPIDKEIASISLSNALKSQIDGVRDCLTSINLSLDTDVTPSYHSTHMSPLPDEFEGVWIVSMLGRSLRTMSIVGRPSEGIGQHFPRVLLKTPNIESLKLSRHIRLDQDQSRKPLSPVQTGATLKKLRNVQLEHGIHDFVQFTAEYNIHPCQLERLSFRHFAAPPGYFRPRVQEVYKADLQLFSGWISPLIDRVIENNPHARVLVRLQNDCVATIGDGTISFQTKACAKKMLDMIEEVAGGRLATDVEIIDVQNIPNHIWLTHPAASKAVLRDGTRSLLLRGCGVVPVTSMLQNLQSTDYLRGLTTLSIETVSEHPASFYSSIENSVALLAEVRPALKCSVSLSQ